MEIHIVLCTVEKNISGCLSGKFFIDTSFTSNIAKVHSMATANLKKS